MITCQAQRWRRKLTLYAEIRKHTHKRTYSTPTEKYCPRRRFRRSSHRPQPDWLLCAQKGAGVRGTSATSGKGGRVGVTTEMEIDVMKGLVLAQHQRIERQRLRMQELERDLRYGVVKPRQTLSIHLL